MKIGILISLLATLFIWFATPTSGTGGCTRAHAVAAQEHRADCHSTTGTECGQPQGNVKPSALKITHNCCPAFVGIVSTAAQTMPMRNASEKLSHHLPAVSSARNDDIYRPPRQIS